MSPGFDKVKKNLARREKSVTFKWTFWKMQGAMRLKSVVKEGKGTNEFARYHDKGKKKRRYLRRRILSIFLINFIGV